jgi:hypothetical protein
MRHLIKTHTILSNLLWPDTITSDRYLVNNSTIITDVSIPKEILGFSDERPLNITEYISQEQDFAIEDIVI